ncbi:hypothetical protein K440DRAFT_521688, partial [Wilcoxina mikolae CBS 423.85]
NIFCSIIAVTGLAGHAYGSWRHRQYRAMWLKDFPPKDIQQNVRIMTYGYNTKLDGGNGNYSIRKHTQHFIRQLIDSRPLQQMKRPIIFIGHSLGGILI